MQQGLTLFQEVLAVVFELVDRLVHVGQGGVALPLFKSTVDLGPPTLGQLFKGADIHIAVMQKSLQLGHVLDQKASVLADGVAAQG